MNSETTSVLLLLFICTSTFLYGQSNVKYGADYIVFEAEDTTLNNLWTVRTPSDSEYLKYLTDLGNSPAPINNTYLEYTGPWQGAGSELAYKFTCPKTGAYRLAMRMHCPLRTGEGHDQRNDVFIKLAGNFTSGNTSVSENDARTLHKFYGRGPNKWGTGINLEHNGHHRLIYNLIEGEEYTFTMKGRSTGASYDYIAFYTDTRSTNQITDLALQLPSNIRPYSNITQIAIINPTPGEIRENSSSQLIISTVPENASSSAIWSSSDDQIISVDENGKITALGNIGQKATITATSTKNNTISTSNEIEIVAFFEIPVASVNITNNNTSIVTGSSITLNKEVLPTSTHDPTLTWSSSNTSIATVNIDGKVTGIKEGNTIIKAQSNQNNTIFDEITINVVAFAEHSVSFDDDNKYIHGTFYNEGNMEVTFNYNAGALHTITKPIKLFFREMNSSWAVQKDIVLEFTNQVGTSSGSVTANIPLDGLTPSSNLATGNFYFLFVVIESSNGNKVDKGLNPIIILDKTLSTSNNFHNKIKIYPNPSTDYFTIENNTNITNLEASIFDVTGKQVYINTISNNKISTSKFKPGLYIIRLKGEGILVHKKIIMK